MTSEVCDLGAEALVSGDWTQDEATPFEVSKVGRRNDEKLISKRQWGSAVSKNRLSRELTLET